jgi:hypothetical protein
MAVPRWVVTGVAALLVIIGFTTQNVGIVFWTQGDVISN